MSILNKNDQKGRSMVEMLGVLAIIGVLSVGGISGYSKAMAKFKLTKKNEKIKIKQNKNYTFCIVFLY